MVIKRLFFIVIAICIVVFIGFGQDQIKKLRKGECSLIGAYTQRILPGRRESRIIKESHFIVVWENKDYPKSFFWLNGTDTMKCNIARAHKIAVNNTHGLSGRPDYYSENIPLNKIKQGDTLDISRPNDLPKNQKNTLLYTTGNKNARYGIKVDSIIKKRDIAMP